MTSQIITKVIDPGDRPDEEYFRYNGPDKPERCWIQPQIDDWWAWQRDGHLWLPLQADASRGVTTWWCQRCRRVEQRTVLDDD